MLKDDYTLGKELHRGVETALFLAHRVGKANRTAYAARRFSPAVALNHETDARDDAEAFIETGRLQRSVAEIHRSHWVRVRDADWWDPESGQACVVYDYHPQSLRKLIDGRVKLEPATLYAIVRAILDGLKAFEDVAHRPHGALSPDHVLFASANKLKIPLLTSPAHRARDLPPDWHELGRLIYETVCFRLYTRAAGWPLRPAREWQRLGSRGDAWRDFCSRLLNPGIRASVDDIHRGLNALKPSRRKRIGRMAGSVIAAAVAAAALLTLLPATRDWPGPRFLRDAAQALTGLRTESDSTAQRLAWQEWCTHYASWFGPLVNALTSERRALWMQDVFLREAFQTVDDAISNGTILDPRVGIGISPAAFLNYVGAYPPAEALTPEAIAGTEAALVIIARVDTALSAEQWPDRARLAQGIADFQNRGWMRTARYLESIETAIPGSQAVRPDVEAIDKTLKLAHDLANVERLWADVAERPDRDARVRRLREAEGQPQTADADATALARLVHILTHASLDPDRPDPETPTEPVDIAKDRTFAPTQAIARVHDNTPHWVTKQDVSVTGSETIARAWQTQAILLAKQAPSKEALQKQAQTLRSFLRDLDWMVPLGPPPRIGESATANTAQMEAKLWMQREETLGTLLAGAFASAPVPDRSAAQFLETEFASDTLSAFDRLRMEGMNARPKQ